jgi:hypothetical protein
VRAGPFVERTIEDHQPLQAGFVEHDHVIQTLATSGSNKSLDEWILPRRARCREHFLNSVLSENSAGLPERFVAFVAASDSAGCSIFTIARRDGLRSQIRRLGPLMGHYGFPLARLPLIHDGLARRPNLFGQPRLREPEFAPDAQSRRAQSDGTRVRAGGRVRFARKDFTSWSTGAKVRKIY